MKCWKNWHKSEHVSKGLFGSSDIDECRQNPCVNGRCDNTAGSYRCICRLGYRLVGNTCTGKGPPWLSLIHFYFRDDFQTASHGSEKLHSHVKRVQTALNTQFTGVFSTCHRVVIESQSANQKTAGLNHLSKTD